MIEWLISFEVVVYLKNPYLSEINDDRDRKKYGRKSRMTSKSDTLLTPE